MSRASCMKLAKVVCGWYVCCILLTVVSQLSWTISLVAAFAPMNAAPASQESRDLNWNAQRRPFDAERFTRDWIRKHHKRLREQVDEMELGITSNISIYPFEHQFLLLCTSTYLNTRWIPTHSFYVFLGCSKKVWILLWSVFYCLSYSPVKFMKRNVKLTWYDISQKMLKFELVQGHHLHMFLLSL